MVIITLLFTGLDCSQWSGYAVSSDHIVTIVNVVEALCIHLNYQPLLSVCRSLLIKHCRLCVPFQYLL